MNSNDIIKLHNAGLKLYYHTADDISQLVWAFTNGADGVYSDIYTPNDINEWKTAIQYGD